MVIHEESESPEEIAVIRKPGTLEAKKYLMINNHIRELARDDSPSSSSSAADEISESSRNVTKKRSTKKSKKRKIESKENSQVTEISESDLLELRTVYRNCLTVINKIESKYGHLLDIDRPSQYNHCSDSELQRHKEVCNCKKKKIVFDDDGQQHTQEIEDHICPTRTMRYDMPTTCSVSTESEEYNLTLPDDLPSLAELLRDPKLNHRNKVIDKIKNIKQDHLNELRFNRPALIQAVKRDPEQVLGFTGDNLSSLPGYQ